MTPEVEQRHDDLEKTIQKLSNGHRGDPIAMSEGIVNISKTLQVMLKQKFVTQTECAVSHDKLVMDLKKTTKFGWKNLTAVVVSTIVVCSTLFGLGHHLINTIWGSPAPKVIIESAASLF
jgi:hypothetical protein